MCTSFVQDGLSAQSSGCLSTDLYNYSGDIIFSTVLVCEGDEFIAQFFKVFCASKHLEQILVSNHFPQAIGAEQEDIPWLYEFVEDIYLNSFVPRAQGTIDDVTLRMGVDGIRLDLI